MPLSRSIQTGSLLVATALAAAGLNLGVLSLGAAEPEATATVDEAQPAGAETVALSAGQPAVVPVARAAQPAQPAPLAAEAAPAPATSAVDSAAPAPSAAETTSPPAERASEETSEVTDHRGEDVERPVPQESERRNPVPETSAAPGPEAQSTTSSRPATTPPPAPETSPPTSEETTTTMSPPTTAATEYVTYEFHGVATIIIAIHDGRRLEFWSATPESGWVFRVDDDTPSKVKIKFRPLDGGDEAEWELKVEGDELKLKQEY